jgi:hypothetical protein
MFQKWFRKQGFARPSVDAETRDAISGAENTRLEDCATAANLEARGVGVDTGCTGTELRGLELTVPFRGLVTETRHISEKRRSDHFLDALFDDLTLSGSLFSVTISPVDVKLRFIPRRATEVYDVALRRLEEIVAEANHVEAKNSSQGPYR